MKFFAIVALVAFGIFANEIFIGWRDRQLEQRALREYHRQFDSEMKRVIQSYKDRGFDTRAAELDCLYPSGVDDLSYCRAELKELAKELPQ